MRSIVHYLSAVILFSVTVGCSSYPVRAMPSITSSQAPTRGTSAGLNVGAKPYTQSSEIKGIFNYDLLTKGVLPVYLVIENNGSSEVELLRARVQLRTPSGTVCDAVPADAAATGHGRNAVGEAVFLFGIFSYDNANKFNDEMKRDWSDKGLGEVTIVAPGRSVSKFAYFSVGKDFKAPGSQLSLVFTSGSSRPTVTIPLR